MNLQDKYVLLLDHILLKIPSFQIIEKHKSPLMMLLSKVLFFNKVFLSSFTTVIGNRIYVPSSWKTTFPLETKIEIIAHEYVHLMQYKRLSVLFSILYLFPQILCLGALMAIFGNPLWLLCLLFAMPIPAIFRTMYEFGAYRISLFVSYKLFGNNVDKEKLIEYYVSYFTKSNYYFMFPFKKLLTSRFEKCYDRFESGRLTKIEKEIQEVLN